MKTFSITILALLLVACAMSALAQDTTAPPAGPGPGGRMGAGMTCPAMAATPPTARTIERAELQLADGKKTELTAALAKGEGTLPQLREAAGKASRALRTGVMTAGIETEKLNQLVLDAQKAEAAIVTAELQVWTDIRSILTAAQLQKLRESMAARRTGPRFSTPAPNPPAK